jgi:tyrosine-protein kinase Etk/Wzc
MNSVQETIPVGPVEADDEISLLDLVTTLGEEKKSIALIAFAATVVGLVVALILPPIFTGRTTLLPPQGQGGSSASMASFGALAASLGAGGLVKTPEELYIGLLRSDAVADAVIDKLKLRERYQAKLPGDARQALAGSSRFSADRKSSLITIEVDDKEPAVAAQIANAYVEQLRKLLTRIAVTEAQQRRTYFEQQIEKAKSDLANAEVAVKQAQDRSGLLSLDSQTQTTISSAAQIRAQIVTREVQIRALQPYAGPENVELRRLGSELASLRSQLVRIEGGTADAAAPAGRESTQALANVRIFRELKYQEALYSAMLQQLQVARADEARDAPLIQQVDVATPPERKSKPRRAMIVAFALAMGLLAGVVLAFVRHAARRARQDPESARQWQAVARAWSLRKGS